ncbi:hypothetical protein NA78x_000350 [Anatilimnocola sp. NA78]|uniref:hypothetical protein n=1 Tax=Anatilimnocola sp. NA78 TaxID=3415683 RepID=UPI003CE524AC
MNAQVRKMILANEDKIVTYRSPTGLRYVRVANASPDHQPPRHIGQFGGCEILFYTTSKGVMSRIGYVLAGDGEDGLPDGCGAWFTEGDKYKGECADPAAFRLKIGLQSPSIERSSDATIADERKHREPAIEYWAKVAAQREAKAAREAMEQLRAEQEAAAALLAATPKPKPKGWWPWN